MILIQENKMVIESRKIQFTFALKVYTKDEKKEYMNVPVFLHLNTLFSYFLSLTLFFFFLPSSYQNFHHGFDTATLVGIEEVRGFRSGSSTPNTSLRTASTLRSALTVLHDTEPNALRTSSLCRLY